VAGPRASAGAILPAALAEETYTRYF
jgi:hypothetical protein